MVKLLQRITGGRIVLFPAGAAIASVMGGTAAALTSTDFTYSSTKSGYYSISAMALAPTDPKSAAEFVNSGEGSVLAGAGCYGTGINLPQGAIVYSVTNWYSVSSPGFGPRFQLMRQDLQQNQQGYLSYETTAEIDSKRRMVTEIVPADKRKVDNAKFSYYYYVCMIKGNAFSGARIRYFYKTAGD